MSFITILLIAVVALLAGMEGILDEFQFHQPIVACTLIGLVSGYLEEGIILGGSLQMIALGWANIGAAVAPDAALASVASAIIMVKGLGGATDAQTVIDSAIAVAIPLSVAGLFLTMVCRTLAIPIVHFMDAAAEKGNFRGIETWQIIAILMQGVRIAIPAVALCYIPAEAVQAALEAMPAWLADGSCCWLRNGYQHDGYKRNLAILCFRFRCCMYQRNHIDRSWCNRCCYRTCLLRT